MSRRTQVLAGVTGLAVLCLCSAVVIAVGSESPTTHCCANNTAVETNLQTALTAANTSWTQAGSSYDGLTVPESGVSTVTQVDSGLSYATDGAVSTGQHVISISHGSNWVLLAGWEAGQERCYFIVQVRGQLPSPVAGHSSAGTWYGAASVSPQQCRASRGLSGAQSTTGFPSS